MTKIAKWKKFEEAVANIQSLFTPNAEVKRNARIIDRLGHRREFDVVIEDNWSGQSLLGVIECKNLKKRVGTPEVEAFKEKSEKVKANFRAIVSTKGFSKPALEAAKHYGIGTMSLLPNDERIAGFALHWPAYAEIWRWTKASLTVNFTDAGIKLKNFSPFDVKYDGKSVFAWFLRKLKEEYLHSEKEGLLRIIVNFENLTIVTIEGDSYEANGVVFMAWRERIKKHKQLRITGDAFYDWQDHKLKWPNRGAIVTEVIDTHGIDDWDDYEGEFPKLVKKDEELEKNEFRLQLLFKCFGDVQEFGDEIPEIERL